MKTHILLIDNFDSFTFNLVHLIEKVSDVSIDVVRNNELLNLDVNRFDAIVISPGPGIPNEAGQLMTFISQNIQFKPFLGVCLGHQAIAETFGAKLTNLDFPFHGVKSEIHTNQKGIFENLPSCFHVARYHSWVVDSDAFPTELEVTAIDNDQHIMAFQHQTKPITGIQFHPESILSDFSLEMMHNWVNQINQTEIQK